MKKLFGDINLTWVKLITMAIAIGIYTAFMAMLDITVNTSFSDLAATFEVWIFFGIFIIMNSKSAKDSALKCFIFFLISQPLIYIIQDLINDSNLFRTYYKYWFIWTIFCLPMGYIGYFLKKDKWWGLLILTPIISILGLEYYRYLSQTIFSFPRHLLTTIFCLTTLIIYPLAIFKNKKIKITGLCISILLIIVSSVFCLINPPIYSTYIASNGNKYHFDNTYKVYLIDDKYGKLSIEYEKNIEDWMIHADFKKAGQTEFILETPNGDKKRYSITIKRDTYKIKEINEE